MENKRIFEAGRLVGPYRIIGFLGSGGMGEVYEVEHTALKVRRALKVFAIEDENAELFRKRFLSEGKVLSALDHPRVVHVHDFAIDELSSLPYFVMDLVLDGAGRPRTLEDERCTGISEERAAAIMRDIADGLAYIHSKGIVHRDIKLQNILIGADGHAVLADFGISFIFNAELRRQLDITLTMPHDKCILRNLGSAYYLAPELLEQKDHADATPASDFWAFGVLLYRLLTGIWFEATNRTTCLAVLDQFSVNWRPVIEALCAETPEERRLVRTIPTAKPTLCIGPFVVLGAVLLLAAIAFFVTQFAVMSRPQPQSQCQQTEEEPPPAPLFNPAAPAWDEYSKTWLVESNRKILRNLAGADGEIMSVLSNYVEMVESPASYFKFLPEKTVRKIDHFVSEQIRNGRISRANSVQFFILSGEVYRQKRQHSFMRGEFPDDVARIAELGKRFIQDASEQHEDLDWVITLINATLPMARAGKYGLFRMDTNAQILLSPYLRSMVMACLLDSEANHIRAGRPDMTPEEWKEYVEKKHLARSECLEALCADPRYTAARLMLALSLGDIGASRRWFATCQDFCCDNLGMLTQGAYNLTSRWGGSTELIEDFLDRALESNRYDTFLPAYYVLGRWQVLAKYEKSFDVCDADERGWAYTDPEVRRKTLEVIRKYKDSDTLARTHGQNRNVFLAVFAAVALTCEDEPLAKELVLRLPKADFYCIIDQAAREGTRMFSKLSRLYRGLNATPPLISKTRATGKGPLLQTLNLPRSYRLTLLIKAHHENGVPGWPEFAFMLGRPIRCANPNVAAGVYVGNWADTWRVNPIKEKGFRPTEIADSWFYDVSEIPFLHNNPSILTDADGKGPLEVIIELQNDLLTIYVAGEKIVDHFDVAKETDRYEGGEQLTSREQFLWLERMEIVSATLSE